MIGLLRSALDASPKLTLPEGSGESSLSSDDRDELTRWARGTTTPQRVAVRSVIVLLAASGWPDTRIAAELGVTRRTAALWRKRFAARGREALLVDAPGRGRKPGRNRTVVARIKALSVEPPPEGARWTARSLARVLGISHATVHRVWREHRIQPRQVDTQ